MKYLCLRDDDDPDLIRLCFRRSECGFGRDGVALPPGICSEGVKCDASQSVFI